MPAAPVEIHIQATGVDGVQRQLRLVKSEVENVGKASTEISHSALIGFSELARGVGKVAQAGEVGAFAMREFTGAAFRLGEFLGPAGPLIPIIGMVGFALYEVFHKAGDEMDKMKEKFHETLDDMVNAGDVAKMKKQAMDLYRGTPAGAFQDGIVGLQGRYDAEKATLDALVAQRGGNPFAPKELVESIKTQQKAVDALAKALSDAKIQFDQIKEAIIAVNNTPLNFPGLAAMNINAARAGFRAPQQALYEGGVGGRYRFEDANAAMFGLLPGLTGEKDHGGKYIDPKLLKIKAADIPRDLFGEAQGEILKQWQSTMRSMQNTMVTGIAGTLSDALSDAFTGSFDQIGKDAEAGLGGIIANMGGILVQWGTTMLPLATLFSKDPLTAGLQAIGMGILLEGLGKALGKAAHGGSGGYGGAGGAYSSAAGAYSSQQSITGLANQRRTVVFKGSAWAAMFANPTFREEFTAGLRELSNDGNLDFLFED